MATNSKLKKFASSCCACNKRIKVAAEIEGTGGKILKTSLSPEDEAKLQAVSNQARQSG